MTLAQLTERQVDNKWLTKPPYCTVQYVAAVVMKPVIGFTGNAFLQAVVFHLISLPFLHHMLLLCIYLCSHTAVRRASWCHLSRRSDLLMLLVYVLFITEFILNSKWIRVRHKSVNI